MVSRQTGFPKPMTKAEEAEAFAQFHAGDLSARDRLIKHNLRLVAHIVKKYNGAAEAEDLIGQGTVGLIKAIRTFKPEKGVQVSTYAARCIENEILMFLRVNKKHNNTGSLDDSWHGESDGDDICLLDIMTDDRPNLAETKMRSELFDQLVEKMRERLDDREFRIIALRYGFGENGSTPLAQREVAKKLGISRSYISRIEKHALEVIREIATTPPFKNAFTD